MGPAQEHAHAEAVVEVLQADSVTFGSRRLPLGLLPPLRRFPGPLHRRHGRLLRTAPPLGFAGELGLSRGQSLRTLTWYVSSVANHHLALSSAYLLPPPIGYN